MKNVHFGGRFAYLCLSSVILAIGTASADIPRTMNYQGVLTDAVGTIVPDGVYNLDFRLYDQSDDGVPLWSESRPEVAVAGGLLTVMLGEANTIDLPFDRPYWLGVTINGETELQPRTPLGAAPYALASANQPGIAQTRGPGNLAIIGNIDSLLGELQLTITIPAAGYIAVDASGMIGIFQAVGLQAVIYGIVESSASFFPAEWGHFYYAGFGTVPNNDYLDIPYAGPVLHPRLWRHHEHSRTRSARARRTYRA